MTSKRHRPHLLALAAFAAVMLFSTSALAAEDTDFISRTFLRGGVVALLAAYLAGLAACATPCVYPMVGITVTVFGAKEAKSRGEAALLSSLFVLGIAALYVPLGIVVATSGGVWGRALSNPWVSGGLAILFGAMAASMFGAFEIALPASIQNKISTVGGVGPKGAFLLGLASGLIASPCTTAPFGLILGSFATKGLAMGTTGVFLFSLGLGTPFFLVGTFAARLPKPGAWMQHVKSVFGVALLVIALFYLKNAIPALRHVARHGTGFLLVTIGALLVGGILGAFHLHFDGPASHKIRKGFGIALATFGGFALVGWMQLPPLQAAVAIGPDPAGSTAGSTNVQLRPVVWATNADEARGRATREGKPMIVDFTADWCAACKEMEKTTFVDGRFYRAAERFVALRIDGTDEDAPAFSENAKRWEIKGLPAVVVLDSQGNLYHAFRKKVEVDELVAVLSKVK